MADQPAISRQTLAVYTHTEIKRVVTPRSILSNSNVLTQDAPNLDFQVSSGGSCAVGTVYSQGQTCTVKFTFTPTDLGPRYGAVVLYDNSSPANAAATTYIQGAGNGPQVVYSPAGTIEFGSGCSSLAG